MINTNIPPAPSHTQTPLPPHTHTQRTRHVGRSTPLTQGWTRELETFNLGETHWRKPCRTRRLRSIRYFPFSFFLSLLLLSPSLLLLTLRPLFHSSSLPFPILTASSPLPSCLIFFLLLTSPSLLSPSPPSHLPSPLPPSHLLPDDGA